MKIFKDKELIEMGKMALDLFDNSENKKLDMNFRAAIGAIFMVDMAQILDDILKRRQYAVLANVVYNG